MRYSPRFILKTSFVAIVCGFITGYSLFQAQNLINGPMVDVSVPRESSQSEVATISGEARNAAFLTFNDREIHTDKDGNFTEKFVLSDGYNIVKINAKDKFGRTTERTIELVYQRADDGDGGKLSVIDSAYGQKE